MDFGFIITRHVNSVETNKYWNHCVKLIRILYPLKKIVIIDDNSDKQFLKTVFDYKNLTIIESEFKGAGEILPYYYYLKYKWFDSAVIIHDSLFIHKRIAFDKIKIPVIPLWHFNYDKENLYNIVRLTRILKNNNKLLEMINNSKSNVLGLNENKQDFVCCFGVQCYIHYNFLLNLENKYNITNLVNYVKNRPDRCCVERIMGLLFSLEHYDLYKYKSLFGNIQTNGTWGYTYNQYIKDISENKLINVIVKVWTGR